ncbi:nucleoside deaminase [Actinomadura physcomitrii]|nr:nucleoside deaminase [Actinomadura physcomitrii]
MKTSVEQMMDICIGLAREAAASGNYALGALVVRDGEVLAESGSSLIVDDDDPSAHPEMSAIRAAARRTGSRYLRNAVLFSTLEPCPMCVSAAIWAKMDGVVFGATQQDALDWAALHPSDVYTWRQIRITAREIARAGEPRIDVRGGVLRAACKELFALTPARPDAG